MQEALKHLLSKVALMSPKERNSKSAWNIMYQEMTQVSENGKFNLWSGIWTHNLSVRGKHFKHLAVDHFCYVLFQNWLPFADVISRHLSR